MGVQALGNDGFACRHCYNLPYASQNESRADRLNRAQRKLADRIFEDEELYIKKRGMHQKTFERLVKKYEAIEDAWNYDLLVYCQQRGLISEAQIFQDHFDYKEKFC